MIDQKDITLEHIANDHILVLCNFAGVANEWPPSLKYGQKNYNFAHQEAMDMNHAKHYAGRARYNRVTSELV